MERVGVTNLWDLRYTVLDVCPEGLDQGALLPFIEECASLTAASPTKIRD